MGRQGNSLRRTRRGKSTAIFAIAVALTAAACAPANDTAGPEATPSATAPSTPAATPAVSTPPAATPTETPPPEPTPVPDWRTGFAGASFEEDDCHFPLPADTDPTCGWIEVPQSTETDLMLSLPVAVFPATGDTTFDDPVVFLHGGPNSGFLTTFNRSWSARFALLNTHRDVVVFDQRGSGMAVLSEPCTILPSAQLLDRQVASRYFIKALVNCSDERREEGIDPSAYGADDMAVDVARLAVALDYDQLNLYGSSHGGRVAQSVLARYPGLVRSTVLDSPLAFETDLISSMPGSFEQAIDNLDASCQRTPSCAATFDDLGESIIDVLAAAEEEPISVNIWQRRTASSLDLPGGVLSGFVFTLFYLEEQLASIPALFAELTSGKTTLLERLVNENGVLVNAVAPEFAWNMCIDEVPLTSEERVRQSLTNTPLDLVNEPPDGRGLSAFDLCDQLAIEPVKARRHVIDAQSPAFVLSGAYDPITPIADSELLSQSLPRAFYVEFPDLTHGVGLDRCAASMIAEFVDAPHTAPDTSCLARRTELILPIPAPAAGPPELTLRDLWLGSRELQISLPTEWSERWFSTSTLFVRSLTASDNAFVGVVDLSGDEPEKQQLDLGLDNFGTPILDQWSPKLVTDETPCCSWKATAAGTYHGLQLVIFTSNEHEVALVLGAYPDELPALVDSVLVPAANSYTADDQ